jgi:hypothetical protein
MPAEIVKRHYIALAKLLKIYRSAPLDTDLLKASQHFCKSLYDAAKEYYFAKTTRCERNNNLRQCRVN